MVVVLVFGLAVFVGVLAARAQSPPPAAPPATSIPTTIPPPPGSGVNIQTNPGSSPPGAFEPASSSVRVGQTLSWKNVDTIDHSVSFDTLAKGSGVLTPGQVFRWTPKKAGTYGYGCFLHPDMRGTVVVQP